MLRAGALVLLLVQRVGSAPCHKGKRTQDLAKLATSDACAEYRELGCGWMHVAFDCADGPPAKNATGEQMALACCCAISATQSARPPSADTLLGCFSQ